MGGVDTRYVGHPGVLWRHRIVLILTVPAQCATVFLTAPGIKSVEVLQLNIVGFEEAIFKKRRVARC